VLPYDGDHSLARRQVFVDHAREQSGGIGNPLSHRLTVDHQVPIWAPVFQPLLQGLSSFPKRTNVPSACPSAGIT
jgi:hypothetical protein